MNDKLIKQKRHDPFRALFRDIKDLIELGRYRVAVTVNTALILLYWQVGQRINKEILGHERAEYGKQVLQTLSARLTDVYGRGWSERNLAYMVKFAETFTDHDILQTLCAKLSWSHFCWSLAVDSFSWRARNGFKATDITPT